MPPAFNLSQDQTLQFNVSVALRATNPRREVFSPISGILSLEFLTWFLTSIFTLLTYHPLLSFESVKGTLQANNQRKHPHKLSNLIVKERAELPSSKDRQL
jgi:hypothetical protein